MLDVYLYPFRGGSRMISEGVDFIKPSHLLYIFEKADLSKQCRRTPQNMASDQAVQCLPIIWLFYVHIFIGSKMELLKKIVR